MVFAYSRVHHDRRTWWYRSLTLREALKMETRGEVRQIEVEIQDDVVIAYQETTPPAASSEQQRMLYRSPTTLTLATMNAIAIAEKNVKLSRGEYAQVIKFKVWGLIGDTKAVAVRPRMSESERAEAEKLLAPRRRPAKYEDQGRHDVRALHFQPDAMAAAA
jgi:hypothetical protein